MSKAKNPTAPEAQHFIRSALKRAARNWPSLLVILGVVVVIGGWRLLVASEKPKHLHEIAWEYGSVAEYWGEPLPRPDGKAILYQQSTESGVGMFFAPLPHGTPMLLCEQAEKGFDQGNFRLWGWSPDGSRFAFTRRPDKESKREIVIGDGNSGAELGVILVDRAVRQLTWLSAQALAYVDDYQELQRVEQLSEKRWGRPEPFLKPALDAKGKPVKRPKLTKEEMAALPSIENLAATSPNSVAFLREQAMWNWEFGQTEATLLWRATNQTLVNVEVDPVGRRLLLQCKDDSGETLSSYHWPSQRLYQMGRIPALKALANRVVWMTGDSYAYTVRGLWNQKLRVHARGSPAEVQFGFEGGLNSLAANASGVYVFGSVAGEPVAIWRLAPGMEAPACVLSNSMASFKFARPIAPYRDSLTNELGEIISYRLWSPPKASARKKYPLLIGKATTRWQGYAASVAQGGAYVISIEQQAEDGEWSSKVLPIIEHARVAHQIHDDELYLYGASGATYQLSRLLEEHPGKWRGAILFSPGVLPDARRFKTPRLLIDCGGEDFRAEVVTKFRDEAAQAGLVVTVSLHENAGHVYRSVSSLRERDLAVMKFLFGR